MTRKVKTSEWCVADAISAAISTFTELADELEGWYENLPEGLQQGDLGDRLQQAIDTLREAENVSIEAGLDDGEGIGGVRFSFTESASKKRQSRRQRCDDAVSLLESAISAAREELDNDEDEETGKYSNSKDDIESCLDELENLCSEAGSVDFPGMYGR